MGTWMGTWMACGMFALALALSGWNACDEELEMKQ